MNSPTPLSFTGSLDRTTVERLRTLAQDTDPGLLAEIFGAYLADATRYASEIHKALAEKNAGPLQHNAHALKGASMNTGALTLAGISARVEDAAESGDLAAVQGLLPELDAEIQRVRADIALELSATA